MSTTIAQKPIIGCTSTQQPASLRYWCPARDRATQSSHASSPWMNDWWPCNGPEALRAESNSYGKSSNSIAGFYMYTRVYRYRRIEELSFRYGRSPTVLVLEHSSLSHAIMYIGANIPVGAPTVPVPGTSAPPISRSPMRCNHAGTQNAHILLCPSLAVSVSSR